MDQDSTARYSFEERSSEKATSSGAVPDDGVATRWLTGSASDRSEPPRSSNALSVLPSPTSKTISRSVSVSPTTARTRHVDCGATAHRLDSVRSGSPKRSENWGSVYGSGSRRAPAGESPASGLGRLNAQFLSAGFAGVPAQLPSKRISAKSLYAPMLWSFFCQASV